MAEAVADGQGHRLRKTLGQRKHEEVVANARV